MTQWTRITSDPNSLPPPHQLVFVQARSDLPCVGYWEPGLRENKPAWNYVVKIETIYTEIQCNHPDRWMPIPEY